MSQPPSKISQFLSDKPQIGPVSESPLLARLKNLLPQMEEANKNLVASSSGAEEFIIEKVEESSDSSSSSESESEDEDEAGEEDQGNQEVQKADRIEIDVDVFREKNSRVDNRDVSVQEVNELPEAFQAESSGNPEKVLIEEL